MRPYFLRMQSIKSHFSAEVQSRKPAVLPLPGPSSVIIRPQGWTAGSQTGWADAVHTNTTRSALVYFLSDLLVLKINKLHETKDTLIKEEGFNSICLKDIVVSMYKIIFNVLRATLDVVLKVTAGCWLCSVWFWNEETALWWWCGTIESTDEMMKWWIMMNNAKP